MLVRTVGADEVAHVLDDADDRDFQLLEHGHAFGHILQGDVLRCRHDDHAGQWDQLRQAQRRVTRARRQVNHQVIEVTPVEILQKLLDSAVDHRSAPDDRLAFIQEKANRDQLDAVAHDRLDRAIATGDLGLFLDAHHQRHVRPVDVGVQQTDACARLRQGHGQVDAGGALADAAFARGDGDHILDPRDEWRARPLAARDGRAGGHLDLHFGNPWQTSHRHLGLIA